MTVVILTATFGRAMAQSNDIRVESPIAITNARIVASPGEIIERATILIDKGRIMSVGTDVAIPGHAERFDASGMVVYAGFIDACTNRGISQSEPSADELIRVTDETPDVREGVQSAMVEAYRRLVHPHWRVAELFDPVDARREDARAGGFTATLVAPQTAIFSGESAVISMGELPVRRSIVRDGIAQHAAFVTRVGAGRARRGGGGGGESSGYPATTMGAIALFRQTLMDAQWHRDLLAWSDRQGGVERIPYDRDLEALWPLIDGRLPVALLANSEEEIHRALDVAAEFDLRPIIIGGKEAWKVSERLSSEGVPVVLSLKGSDEPKKPKKRAEPTTQAVIDEAESLARGPDRSAVFDKAWEEQAWEPKRIYEERERLRFEEIDNAKMLREAGVLFAFASYELKSPSEVLKQVRTAIERGLSEDAAVAALTSDAASILGVHALCGQIAPGHLANLTLLSGPLAEKESEVKWVFVEGRAFDLGSKDKREGARPAEAGGRRGRRGASATRDEPSEPRDVGKEETETEEEDEPSAAKAPSTGAEGAPSSGDAATTQPATTSAPATQPDETDLWPEFQGEIEADRRPRLQTGGRLLLKNATLLTITEGERVETDLLIEDGRIAAIGGSIPPPPDVTTIDARGYYVTPGLIDAHSHACTSGGLNEWSLSVTPEVRIADVINPKDVGAFRALAGGITMIHTMHGSANTIGGQNVVVRLKYGRPVKEWRFVEAPRSVKFALGENVKQSNSQTRGTRFPNTRMGVEAVFHRSFDAALKYKKRWDAFELDRAAGKDPMPPRRDLRLDALCDIHAGRIWVHCHCYRADEILRLLDMAESFGFRIAVLQHVLEGYRVIPEVLRHGASTSTFSDWWAYKIEAYDAVPHNAARMAQAGIVTTVNSDSHEVIRHMNLEAAKSVRFGGLSPNDALRLVTINAAIQLGVDKHVGSIELGKRADLAIFDGHPLDTLSRCMMTLIDGEVYFQHEQFDPAAPPTPMPGREFDAAREPLNVVLSPRGEYWIRGATVHPISGPPIEDGVVIIADGRIRAVGAAAQMSDTPSSGASIINAAGLHVYPGLICAGVTLGLFEIGSVQGTVDQNEIARFQPDVLSLSGYNPFASAIGVARSEGVTSALICSGGGVVQGQAGVVHLDGWSMPEARSEAAAGLFVQLPSLAKDFPWWMDEEAKERQAKEFPKTLAAVEEFFRTARQYERMKTLGERNADMLPEQDRRLDAMLPYLRGEKPVFFRADSFKAIREALRFAEKYELRPVIFGGREAWKLADELAEKRVDVVIARSMALPSGEFEPWDSVYRNAAELHRRGVRFCFTVGEASLAKQLGIEAGMAAAHGLEPRAALEAITIDAARILGLGDSLGSLDTGKIADVIITTDSPLQATNRVVAAFIRGVPVDLENKHTLDDAKFRSRPTPALPPNPEELRGPPAMRMTPAGTGS